MSRPRAADDFVMIRARLRELRGERTLPAECEPAAEDAQCTRDAERRSKERHEGVPPPWAPTIFLRR
jgi:hypothetical protein